MGCFLGVKVGRLARSWEKDKRRKKVDGGRKAAWGEILRFVKHSCRPKLSERGGVLSIDPMDHLDKRG
jgi:hypothetical protein